MSSIITTLKVLNVDEDEFIAMTYTDGTNVWHINESHVEETVAETTTAALLAAILVYGIPVYTSDGAAILEDLRADGHLDDYDHEGGFEQYLEDIFVNTIYDQSYLSYSTTHYDYKRGRCDITASVQVRVGDLYVLEDDADSFIGGFEVSVPTPGGTLTLNA